MSKLLLSQVSNSQDRLVLVKFYADWCGPCLMIKRLVAAACESAGFALIGFESDHSALQLKIAGVQALPTLIAFVEGREVWRHVSAITEQDLIAKLESLK